VKIVSRALPAVVNSLGVEEHAVLAPWDMCKAWWKMHVVVIVFVVGSPGYENPVAAMVKPGWAPGGPAGYETSVAPPPPSNTATQQHNNTATQQHSNTTAKQKHATG
jgi:hypothetical protein